MHYNTALHNNKWHDIPKQQFFLIWTNPLDGLN